MPTTEKKRFFLPWSTQTAPFDKFGGVIRTSTHSIECARDEFPIPLYIISDI